MGKESKKKTNESRTLHPFGESPPVRINFTVFGRKDLWAELVNIADESWGVASHYMSLGVNMTNDDIEELLVRYIIRWNLPSSEDGSVLPVPSEDRNVVAKLPMKVIAILIGELIGVKAATRLTEDALVPPQNGNTS